MHVQRVNTQVEGCEVHGLKDVLQRLTPATLDVHDLLWIFFHGSLDESQQVLLVHAG